MRRALASEVPTPLACQSVLQTVLVGVALCQCVVSSIHAWPCCRSLPHSRPRPSGSLWQVAQVGMPTLSVQFELVVEPSVSEHACFGLVVV